MSDQPRLRGHSGLYFGPWNIGQIPKSVIYTIGKLLVNKLAIGSNDIAGNEFGDIFADAVDGRHYSSPLGLADVARSGTGWSVKTIKANKPYEQVRVRLISGRNSPDYSLGIENPHTDLKATGKAVLSVWNSRLNATRGEHDDVRVAVLIRNMAEKQFVLFEEEVTRYVVDDYEWHQNQRGNLQGHRKTDDKYCFTWQFHGSQFTVIREVPGSAIKFRIVRNVPLVEPVHIERIIGYNDDWIEIG